MSGNREKVRWRKPGMCAGEEPKSRRWFTLEEANCLVPRLEMAFTNVHRWMARLRDITTWMRLSGGSDLGPLRAELARLMARVDKQIESINGNGCEVKDVAMGWVDFPAVGDEDEEVAFCWQFGEKEVSYYHLPTEGFGERKPLHGLAKIQQERLLN